MKSLKTPGTSYRELVANARKAHRRVQKRTPRRHPYVRSKYFNGDKVFISSFWVHIQQKRIGDQIRRLKLYDPALELLRNTNISPDTITERQHQEILLHRFCGTTKDGITFGVQVK